MDILELSSNLKEQQDKIADEMIREFRKDTCYLQDLMEIERKIAICKSNEKGSILIKIRGNQIVIS